MARKTWFSAGLIVGLAVGAGIAPLLETGDVRNDGAGVARESVGQAGRDAPVLLGSPTAAGAPQAAPADEATRRPGPAVPTPASDPVGVVVYGALLDPDGNGVDADWLTLTDAAKPNERRLGNVRDTKGYAVTGLYPGTWTLATKADGFKSHSRQVEIGAVPVQRIDVHLEASTTLQVRIRTPDGKPLEESLVVVATREPPPGRLPMTDLRSHSKFDLGEWKSARGPLARFRGPSFPEGVDGQIEASATPPFSVSLVQGHVVLATQRVAHDQTEVAFEVTPADVLRATATVHLTVLDARTGDAVSGARVGFANLQGGGGGGGRIEAEDGTLVLERQIPGLLDLQIQAEGYEYYQRLVRLEPGRMDLGTIKLARSRTLRGTVVDESGAPQQARVMWTNLDRRTFPQALRGNRIWRCEADGTFAIEGMGTGRYLVRAFVEREKIGIADVSMDGLGEEPIRIVVEPLQTVSVDAQAMSPARRYVVTLWDGDLPVCAVRLRGPYAYSAPVPKGSFTYEIHEGLKLHRRGTIEVDGKQPARIEVP